MLVVKCGAAEVDKTSVCALDAANLTILSSIKRCSEFRVYEEDILWLKISMGQFVIMEEFDSVAKLVRDVSDVVDRVWLVVVVLQKIEDTEAENLKSDASVAVVIEPIENLHAQMFRCSLVLKLLQSVDFQLGCFSILFHVLYDLQSHRLVHHAVLDLYDSTDSTFSQVCKDLVTIKEGVASVIDQVTICIVPD